MQINVDINTGGYPVNKKIVQETVDKYIKFLKNKKKIKIGRRDIELSIAFIANKEIRKINRNYRGIDAPTDVLSFGNLSREEEFSPVYAEIIISFDTARSQSREFGVSLNAEITRLLVHGFVHLLGYDHKTKAQMERMENLEGEIIVK